MQDQEHKKVNRPKGGSGADLELEDISGQVPEIDDILAEVDKAIAKADSIENAVDRALRREQERREQERTRSRGCGCL